MTGAVHQAMRAVLGILFLGVMGVMVGCAEEDTSTPSRHNSKTDGSSGGGTSGSSGTNPTGTNPTTTSAAVTACAALPAPTSLSEAKDATDIHIAGTAIFFQTGASVNRVLKNGADKKTVFTSTNLTHSWADAKGLLLVEATGPDNPNATLRSFNANGPDAADDNPNPSKDFPQFTVGEGEGGPGGATANTNFNSASALIFAADVDNYYLTAEDGNGNNTIVAINRGNPGQQAALVTTTNVISNPQIASSAVWWVEEGNRVFKIALATGDQPAGEKKEVFGVGTSCSLAVNELNAFCSQGASIEQRDLTGTSPKVLMDVTASKAPAAPYGQPFYFDSHLYLRNLSADKEIKNVIRSIATSAAPDEKLVACNREGTITGIAVDKDNVIWSESGVGVFMAPR